MKYELLTKYYIILDKNGIIMNISLDFVKFTFYKKTEIIGKHLSEFVSLTTQINTNNLLNILINNSTPDHLSVIVKKRNSGNIELLLNPIKRYDEENNLKEILLYFETFHNYLVYESESQIVELLKLEIYKCAINSRYTNVFIDKVQDILINNNKIVFTKIHHKSSKYEKTLPLQYSLNKLDNTKIDYTKQDGIYSIDVYKIDKDIDSSLVSYIIKTTDNSMKWVVNINMRVYSQYKIWVEYLLDIFQSIHTLTKYIKEKQKQNINFKKLKKVNMIDIDISIWNKKKFDIEIKKEIKRFLRYQHMFSIIKINIEENTNLNNTKSFKFKWIIKKIKKILRTSDSIFKDTDNCFYILLPGTSTLEASSFINKMYKEFNNYRDAIIINSAATSIKDGDSLHSLFERLNSSVDVTLGGMNYNIVLDEKTNLRLSGTYNASAKLI